MSISLWRYRDNRRNYPGYHLSADREGCVRLVAVLSVLQSAKRGLAMTVPLAAPTAKVLSVPNNWSGLASLVPFDRWLVTVDSASDEDRLVFTEAAVACRLSLSPSLIPSVIAGVRDIENGKGDYCIGEGDHSLWFWWQVPLRRPSR
jgi:hypothetical protein